MGPEGPAQRHPTPPGRPAAGLRFLDFDSFLLSSRLSSCLTELWPLFSPAPHSDAVPCL